MKRLKIMTYESRTEGTGGQGLERKDHKGYCMTSKKINGYFPLGKAINTESV